MTFFRNASASFRGRFTRTKLIALICFLLLLTLTPLTAGWSLRVSAQQSFPNILSYRVSGAPNYSSPGSESFWSTINWTEVPLAASVAPGGGHTPDLLVKSANTGYDIYMLFRWNDSSGPSYLGDPEVYRASNGSLIALTPTLTANVTQLFYNSSYYYPDRVAMLWFFANQSEQQQSPKMLLGSDGAITGGAAEIWHWQSNPTDNYPNDTGFPGGYTDPMGNPIYPSDNLSFAEDDFTNTSGFYVVGGSFGNSTPNLDPYADPFLIHVGSSYSYSNKTWTVEMVRSFQTNDGASQYRVQLSTGSSYFVSLGVWQGRLGESSDFKSVSLWYTLTVSDQSPVSSIPATKTSTPILSSTTTTVTSTQNVTVTPTESTISGGPSFNLALITAVATLIVGLVAGMVARPIREASAK